MIVSVLAVNEVSIRFRKDDAYGRRPAVVSTLGESIDRQRRLEEVALPLRSAG
jgi:hypothetical protein